MWGHDWRSEEGGEVGGVRGGVAQGSVACGGGFTHLPPPTPLLLLLSTFEAAVVVGGVWLKMAGWTAPSLRSGEKLQQQGGRRRGQAMEGGHGREVVLAVSHVPCSRMDGPGATHSPRVPTNCIAYRFRMQVGTFGTSI